jgi:hypothetical protein
MLRDSLFHEMDPHIKNKIQSYLRSQIQSHSIQVDQFY